MIRKRIIGTIKIAVCLSTVLSASAACSQVLPVGQKTEEFKPDAAASAASPVAWVYISNTPKSGSANEITAYSAAANGSLTAIPGSPFPENVGSMAVNGKYLMGADQKVPDIDAYYMESDGALTYKATTSYDIGNGNCTDCTSAGQIFFDHTGASLYIQEFQSDTNTGVASFEVVKASGGLTYLGYANTGTFPGDNSAAYFTGNDVFAYTAVDSACMYYTIYGFKRASNGLLSTASTTYNLPTPPSGVSGYIPNLAAADPTNHVAFIMQPANPPGCASGAMQLASYTADSSGNLTTTNTYKTMPDTAIANFFDLKMAPSGKLLAIAGQEGLQIFHFNGASPITKYTGLLTTTPITQMYWDNNNHLYAISHADNKLFVFTITPTGYAAVPGSPYTINSPGAIIVQPLPRY
jgi:hypothetical protein